MTLIGHGWQDISGIVTRTIIDYAQSFSEDFTVKSSFGLAFLNSSVHRAADFGFAVASNYPIIAASVGAAGAVYGAAYALNFLSYGYLKNRILRSQPWDLNICCGTTDGGGINADIKKHGDIPNFVLTKDIYNLPFDSGRFNHVLCSHTIEHVDNPKAFYNELRRVGKDVTLVVPPLWDFSAAVNLLEHRQLFFSMRTRYKKLPLYTPLPMARAVQNMIGQRIKA